MSSRFFRFFDLVIGTTFSLDITLSPCKLIVPNKAPTSTLAPVLKLIFDIMPSAGDGTSILTLSVSSSTIGSSSFTSSPLFFIHLDTVASVILSPRAGTIMFSLISLLFKNLFYYFFLLRKMFF